MSDTAKVLLLRPIRYAGEVVGAGDVLTTSVSMAAELVHARKAVPHIEPPVEVAEEPAASVDQAPVGDTDAADQPPAEQA